MITYPEGLPYPQRQGYGFEATENITRTEMDSGLAVQRVEFRKASTTVSVNWLLTEVQGRLLRAWCDQVAAAQWFMMPLLSEMGFDVEEVRLRKRLQGGVLEGQYLWRFTAEIEVRKTPEIEDGWAEILPDWILEPDLLDYAMNREWPLYFFDYPTFAALLADIRNLRDGSRWSVEVDETQDGRHSYYEVARADSPSLSLDFISQTYGVGSGEDNLVLVVTYAG